MKISLPYGRVYLEADIPQSRLCSVLRSRLDEVQPRAQAEELVRQAMKTPVQSLSLDILSQGKKNVVLIASDHTRPVPSRVIVPLMLEAIRRGNPNANITILIATGCHRGTTKAELEEKFGPKLVRTEHIVVHDCTDSSNMVLLGTLPSGGPLWVNRIAAEADLLVSEGFIEPHFFAGYSGGRKSVLPGICARQTVLANHCAAFISNPNARAGCLDKNPIHTDMLWAAQRTGLRFIVNVVLNTRHQVIGAFAGSCDAAHRAGASFLSGLCGVPACTADIVITTNGGHPLDQNIYQAVKGMSTAQYACREGGVIIIAAACEDGHGGEEFVRTFSGTRSAKEILKDIEAIPAQNTKPDQWQSQIFARVLARHHVVFISQASDELVRSLHMTPAHSICEAMEIADSLVPDGRIAVIPDGVSTLIGAANNQE